MASRWNTRFHIKEVETIRVIAITSINIEKGISAHLNSSVQTITFLHHKNINYFFLNLDFLDLDTTIQFKTLMSKLFHTSLQRTYKNQTFCFTFMLWIWDIRLRMHSSIW